jgi:hypothetical protein
MNMNRRLLLSVAAVAGAAVIGLGGAPAWATPGVCGAAASVSTTIIPGTDPNNLILNCGFETDDFTGWNLSPGFSTVLNTVLSTSQALGTFDAGMLVGAHSGGYFAVLGQSDALGGPSEGTISQTLKMPPGATSATLTFWLEDDSFTTDDYFAVQWNGGPPIVIASNSGPGAWTEFTLPAADFPLAPGGTDTLSFIEMDFFGYFGFDDVDMDASGTVVPEPGSLAILLGALAGLGLCRRRRKAA